MLATTPDRVERLRFRRAPLAAAAVWFAAGIVLAHFVWRPVLVVVVALAVLGLLAGLAMRRVLRIAWVPVAGIWVVAGLAAAEWQPGPATNAVLAPYADGLSRMVVGRVTKVQVLPPRPQAEGDADRVAAWDATEEPEPDGERAESIDLPLEQIEEVTPDIARLIPASGGVRMTVYAAGPPALRCGDLIAAAVRLKLPERFRDPGVWQYADYLRDQGIAVRASVAGSRIRRLGEGQAGWRCRAIAAQGWAATRLGEFVGSRPNRLLPGWMRLRTADGQMLDAMLFGDRAGLNRAMRVGFERTGSFHLFVVSGLHVTLLAGGVFWALRRLRAPPWLATVITILTATGYAVLTGFGQPVERALAMTAIFLLARLFWRRGDVANALGAAALIMLVTSPKSLFEASFQMTVLAIIAIAGIAAPLGEHSVAGYARAAKNVFSAGVRGGLAPHKAQLRVMLQLWGDAFAGAFGRWSRGVPATAVRWGLLALELALVGTVAELVMVLPMAMYFHRAAVFAVPANMVVIPVLAVLAPAGVITFAAALVNPWMALLPGAITALLLHGVTGVIGRLSGLSAADVRVPGPATWAAALAVVSWLLCIWAVRRARWGRWVAVFALPVVALMVLWPAKPDVIANRLELTAIDVGQGDSLLLAGPGGGTMLVDAGGLVGQRGPAEAMGSYDIGEEVVSPYLWSRQVRRLDVVVLTHAHSDHMGGMPAILRNFRPRELWVGIDPDSASYRDLLQQAHDLGVTVRHLHAGDERPWDGTTLSVLSPAAGYQNPGAPKNDDSLVLRLDFGRSSLLLEGDAESRSEQAIVTSGILRPVTVLKVGHHGSLTSTSEVFLAAASPRDAIISVGRYNTFGHPRGEVIQRLARSAVHLYRTDEFGLTTFLLAQDGSVTETSGVP